MESVEVTILGQRYVIKGQASKEHITELAKYVDTRIREAYRYCPNTTPIKATILAALSMAEDLKRLANDNSETKQRLQTLESRAESLLNMIE